MMGELCYNCCRCLKNGIEDVKSIFLNFVENLSLTLTGPDQEGFFGSHEDKGLWQDMNQKYLEYKKNVEQKEREGQKNKKITKQIKQQIQDQPTISIRIKPKTKNKKERKAQKLLQLEKSAQEKQELFVINSPDFVLPQRLRKNMIKENRKNVINKVYNVQEEKKLILTISDYLDELDEQLIYVDNYDNNYSDVYKEGHISYLMDNQ